MPRYELSIISKVLEKDGLAKLLRRTCQYLMEKEGVVRKMENLGEQELPSPMTIHSEKFTRGRYFLIDFHYNRNELDALKHELKMDSDVIRSTVISILSPYDLKEKKSLPSHRCWANYRPPFVR